MSNHEQPMKKELEEIIDTRIRSLHTELTSDIMKMKSVSLAEARYIALNFLKAGILPKSEEFYKQIPQITTLQEIFKEYGK